ncbi:MAG TPA: MOSC domain-containing protein [Syntrophorhabdus sp.]|jgi:MOSC domain-containing protein YiiM|nr:MOSC domain-containing protein [Syntrophorhabdus sp.]OPX96336.1 MAG: MOSC domain protein [Syntrophorhabdus sp. PtaB.Bin027]OQB75876.1 MAG: MOSC domain protein [Deltaproteobacteria bacterium ADurb.Bin135]HNS79159.1 MOSC domain-containing protein [Syntrophorhabdus sp.]HNY71303.1 MOSC domain-containing protein [Syntrophorhabdus sp.]
MTGRIVSVNVSKNKGEKKHNIEKCMLIKDMGLKEDAHAGFMHRQVSLLAQESIEKIRKMGLHVVPGDFAENLTTKGIDLPSLPIGTRLLVGNDILLRVTQIGKECHERCAIFQQVGDCVMPREGIFAEVIAEGEVQVGDTITVEL